MAPWAAFQLSLMLLWLSSETRRERGEDKGTKEKNKAQSFLQCVRPETTQKTQGTPDFTADTARWGTHPSANTVSVLQRLIHLETMYFKKSKQTHTHIKNPQKNNHKKPAKSCNIFLVEIYYISSRMCYCHILLCRRKVERTPGGPDAQRTESCMVEF